MNLDWLMIITMKVKTIGSDLKNKELRVVTCSIFIFYFLKNVCFIPIIYERKFLKM